MILYHEVSSASLEDVLRHGLRRTQRGQKGKDESIIQTDRYLDKHRPSNFKRKGISRSNAIYAYVGTSDSIIDISKGIAVPLGELATNDTTALLRLAVGQEDCYVSDLDRYDLVKATLSDGNEKLAYTHAHQYWNSIIPFFQFKQGIISRPEVIITHDIPPKEISLV